MTNERNWDYRRALAELWRRSSYERGLISNPFGDGARAERGLARMRALLAALGDPQLRYATVHVAGSKGKGSTAAFIASAAAEAGHRVGLHTSPHLHRFPERIAVNGQALSDERFAAAAEAVAKAAASLEASRPDLGEVSTFELVTAMAFVAFAWADCDLAVIETGMGGRYDATNVLSPIVTVITRIDLEHTAVLGPTYADIAFQKAGILRAGVPCVVSPQAPTAIPTIERVAAEVGAPLLVAGRDWTWTGAWQSFAATGPWGAWPSLALGTPGPHQVENACTALAALDVLTGASLAIPESAIRAGFAATRWPGRFERHRVSGREVVFDGAHTPAAATALVGAWREAFGATPATVILGLGADKDAAAILRELAPVASRFIMTRAQSPRAADPFALAAAAEKIALHPETAPSVSEAIALAVNDGRPLLITGSLFVAAEGREAFGLAEPDVAWQELNESARKAR